MGEELREQQIISNTALPTVDLWQISAAFTKLQLDPVVLGTMGAASDCSVDDLAEANTMLSGASH